MMKLNPRARTEVFLRVGDQSLVEYDVPGPHRDEPKKMTKYVEATTGANFEIVCRYDRSRVPSACNCLEIDVNIDGTFVESRIFDFTKARTGEVTVDGRCSNRSGSSICEKFAFSELKPVDEPARIPSTKCTRFIERLGEVRVVVRWRKDLEDNTIYENQIEEYTPAFASGVHETELKGRSITNQISLDEAMVLDDQDPIESCSTGRVWRAPRKTVFIFRYRSKRDLQREGVIPRSPSPVALEDRNPDELTPDELRQFMRNFQERREAEQCVKREYAVKRERPQGDECGTGSERKRRGPAEHIDLTED